MASTIPTAMTNLVAALAAAGLPAQDGPAVSDSSATEAIVVGFTSADDPMAVEATSTIEGGTVTPLRELYTIRCAAMVTCGDVTKLPEARIRAYQLLDGVADVLAADCTIGGAVMLANLSDHTLAQSQNSTGAQVLLSFGIACDAFTADG